MTTVSSSPVFQSRWGFHPCDRDTFKKLKRLNFLVMMSLREDAKYQRWANKLPSNRVKRVPIRNQNKQKIGYAFEGNMPEPKGACKDFLNQRMISQFIGIPYWATIQENYKLARTPVSNPADVKALTLDITKIDSLLKAGEDWFASV